MPQSREIRRLREIIAHNSDWLWEVDSQGRYTFCSEHSRHLLGFAPEEVLGKTPFDFMPPDEAARVGAIFGSIAAERRPFSGLINRNIRADGQLIVLETSGVPLFDEAGEFIGYRGIDRNVTPAIGALDRREVQLEALYAAASVALGLVDRDGVLVNVNHALGQLLGGEASQLVGLSLDSCMPGQQQHLEGCLAQLEEGGSPADIELDWQGRTYLFKVQAARDLEGKVLGLTLAFSDISEQRLMRQALADSNAQLALANARLQALASQDYLTGLPNRRRFDEKLSSALQSLVGASHAGDARQSLVGAAARPIASMAGSYGESCDELTLLMVDVDNFKAYNDHYGHQRGDDCLRRLAQLFRETLPDAAGNICRYGGEEFAIILAHTPLEQALQIAERLRTRVFDEHIDHRDGIGGRVSLSIGVASTREAGAQVLYRADQALYQAKHEGRNRSCAGLTPRAGLA